MLKSVLTAGALGAGVFAFMRCREADANGVGRLFALKYWNDPIEVVKAREAAAFAGRGSHDPYGTGTTAGGAIIGTAVMRSIPGLVLDTSPAAATFQQKVSPTILLDYKRS